MKIFIQTYLAIFIILFLTVFPAYGEPGETEVTFPLLWNQIQENAPSEKVSGFQMEASAIEKERDLRLGYPRLYLDARAFSTNDPALSFFSILNQRQIHSSDFNPELLNDPGYPFYQKGTLGLDWPFYDGGAKTARVDFQEKRIQAMAFDQIRGRLDLYAESALLYGSIMVLENESAALRKVLNSTEKLIERYQIGVKNNPLGYLGLLGLKTLKNRILEALIDYGSALNSARTSLSEMAGTLPSNWKPISFGKEKSILPFARLFLPPGEHPEQAGASPSVRMMEAEAESSEELIKEESAKEKPRVALFSEASLYNGNRDSASSYVLGVYLQWDLFSIDRYRKEDQARASALALKAKSDDLRLREKIDQENALHSMSGLEKEIDLLSERSGLLEESSQTSGKLYQNGSISILQVVDVLNQEVDLIDHRMRIERAYLTDDANRFKISGLAIPIFEKGDRHE
jgi:outer membrane protein TolC